MGDETEPTLGDCAICSEPVSPFGPSVEDERGIMHFECYEGNHRD